MELLKLVIRAHWGIENIIFLLFFGTLSLNRIFCNMIIENHEACYSTLRQYILASCFSTDIVQYKANCIIVYIIIHMDIGEFRWPKVLRESLNNVMLPNTVATVNGYMSQMLFKLFKKSCIKKQTNTSHTEITLSFAWMDHPLSSLSWKRGRSGPKPHIQLT